MTTQTFDTDDDTAETLLTAWRAETAQHAQRLKEATELALRYGINDGPQVAERIILKGVQIESDESGAPIYSRDRVELGPFVRVYDPAGRGGDGGYLWAKGLILIPEHAIETVVMVTEDRWVDVAKLSARWPVRPCSESLTKYPSSDADEAETEEDRAQANWCPDCEHTAPVVRHPAGGWVRIAHRVNGEPMSVD